MSRYHYLKSSGFTLSHAYYSWLRLDRLKRLKASLRACHPNGFPLAVVRKWNALTNDRLARNNVEIRKIRSGPALGHFAVLVNGWQMYGSFKTRAAALQYVTTRH